MQKLFTHLHNYIAQSSICEKIIFYKFTSSDVCTEYVQLQFFEILTLIVQAQNLFAANITQSLCTPEASFPLTALFLHNTPEV